MYITVQYSIEQYNTVYYSIVQYLYQYSTVFVFANSNMSTVVSELMYRTFQIKTHLIDRFKLRIIFDCLLSN